MEIYSFKLKSKTNSNIFLVNTNQGEFTLHSDIIVKYKMGKGLINSNIFLEAVQESEILIGLNLSLKYISSKLKTEKQIKDYLYKKDFHKQAVEKILEKLKEYNVINDNTYAESYVTSNPNFSKNKIKQKLIMAGVKFDLSETAVQNIDDDASCLKHAEKYMRNKATDKQTIEKLIRRLQGMGYSWETINHALKSIRCGLEE